MGCDQRVFTIFLAAAGDFPFPMMEIPSDGWKKVPVANREFWIRRSSKIGPLRRTMILYLFVPSPGLFSIVSIFSFIPLASTSKRFSFLSSKIPSTLSHYLHFFGFMSGQPLRPRNWLSAIKFNRRRCGRVYWIQTTPGSDLSCAETTSPRNKWLA